MSYLLHAKQKTFPLTIFSFAQLLPHYVDSIQCPPIDQLHSNITYFSTVEYMIIYLQQTGLIQLI